MQVAYTDTAHQRRTRSRIICLPVGMEALDIVSLMDNNTDILLLIGGNRLPVVRCSTGVEWHLLLNPGRRSLLRDLSPAADELFLGLLACDPLRNKLFASETQPLHPRI
jgi:hypothetical protein